MNRVGHANTVLRSTDRGRFISRAWPIGLLVLLCVVFFRRLLFSAAIERIAGEDITTYLYWLNQYMREELLAGRVPLWIPYIYCGVPFAANPHCALFYPPIWSCLLIPVAAAQKCLVVFHILVGGVFMYVLIRRQGITKQAAVAGCLPWMFGGYVMVHAITGHLTVIFTMAWLPLVLYCCDRAFRDGAYWFFWAGFTCGIQLLAGEPQSTFYTGIVLGIYSLMRALTMQPQDAEQRRTRRLALGACGLVLILVMASMTGAAQILPMLEYTGYSDRSNNSFAFATAGSLHPTSFAGLVIPWTPDVRGLFFMSGHKTGYIDLSFEYAIYVGILPLVLVATSVGLRRHAALTAAKLVLVLAIILMLGANTPIYEYLLRWLPGLRFFRIPPRAALMALWAVSVMSAYGADLVIQARLRPPRRNWRLYLAAGVLSLAAACLIAGVKSYAPITRIVPFPKLPEEETLSKYLLLTDMLVLKPLACLFVGVAGLLLLRWTPARLAGPVVIATIAIDLFMAQPAFVLQPYLPNKDARLQTVRQITEKYDAVNHPYRVDLCAIFIPPDSAIGIRAENVNGRWPMGLLRYYRFVHAMRGLAPNPWTRHQLLDGLYTAGRYPALRVLNMRVTSLINEQQQKIYLEEDRNCLPRAWVVGRAEVLSDEAAILQRMKQPDFDPAQSVILEHDPSLALTPQANRIGTCIIHRFENGELDIETETTHNGYLVLSSVYYPGWQATIDGRKIAPERADYVISAIPLPAGSHRVTYRYRPMSVRIGAACTTVACGTAILLLFWHRRKARRASIHTPSTLSSR